MKKYLDVIDNVQNSSVSTNKQKNKHSVIRNSDTSPEDIVLQQMKDIKLADISDRLIDFRELNTIHGLSRTTVWRLESEGLHPKRRVLGRNSVRWLLSEVQEFIQSL
ncbi:helix-turn-helix transcriptional regulator [Colwellia sp. MEBiC06753]